MKYALLHAVDQGALTDPLPASVEDELTEWINEMTARGVVLDGARLRPTTDATTVRVSDGRKVVTDGPFAETKEVVGGFDILECGSLEEAVEIAAGHPVAQMGTIEVRPLWGS